MTELISNPHFVAYVEMLVELHHIISKGDDSDARATELRERMVEHWYGLSPREIDLADWLSEDLFDMKAESELPSKLSNKQKSILKKLTKAFEKKSWEDVLKFAREASDFFHPFHVSFFRGRAWGALSLPVVSHEFYLNMFRKAPDTEQSSWGLCNAMVSAYQADKKEMANELARQLLEMPANPKYKIIAANHLFFSWYALQNKAVTDEQWREVQVILEQELQKLHFDNSANLSAGFLAALMLGMCYSYFNIPEKSKHFFETAMQLKESPSREELAYALELQGIYLSPYDSQEETIARLDSAAAISGAIIRISKNKKIILGNKSHPLQLTLGQLEGPEFRPFEISPERELQHLSAV